jgi:hypothetical protein
VPLLLLLISRIPRQFFVDTHRSRVTSVFVIAVACMYTGVCACERLCWVIRKKKRDKLRLKTATGRSSVFNLLLNTKNFAMLV